MIRKLEASSRARATQYASCDAGLICTWLNITIVGGRRPHALQRQTHRGDDEAGLAGAGHAQDQAVVRAAQHPLDPQALLRVQAAHQNRRRRSQGGSLALRPGNKKLILNKASSQLRDKTHKQKD